MKSLPLKKIVHFFKYLIIHPICPQIWLGFAPVSQCGSVIVDIPGAHLVFWLFPIKVALSSRGLGQVVLSHQTGVRIPVALPALSSRHIIFSALFNNFCYTFAT